MKKTWKRVLASLMAVIMVACMMPVNTINAQRRDEGEVQFIISFDDISLGNEYDSTFQSTYGKVFYSFDTGSEKTWTPINQTVATVATSSAIENGDRRAYRIEPKDSSVTTMYYKVEFARDYELWIDGQSVYDDSTQPYYGTLTREYNGVNLQFQSGSQGGGDNPGGEDPGGQEPVGEEGYLKEGKLFIEDIYGELATYNSSYISDYGYIQYCVNGTDWNSISDLASETIDGSTYLTLPTVPSGQQLWFRTVSTNLYTASAIGQSSDTESIGLLKSDGSFVLEFDISEEERDALLSAGAEFARSTCFYGNSGVDVAKGFGIKYNPHNILWYTDASYASSHGVSDALVTGGTVEFVSCLMPNGESGLVNGMQQNGIINEGDKIVGGGYSAKEGAILTLRLIPDYGYQFKDAEINGNPVTPQADNYTFTFQFPKGTFHFACNFVPGEDKVNGSASGVGSIKDVSGTAGDTSINGNLLMEATDADVASDVKAKMEATATDTDIINGAYVDLSLESYAVKAASEECWYVPMSETEKDVSVTIAVKDDVAKKIEAAGGVCSIVRAHKNAQGVLEYSEIPAVYNAKNKTITFASNQFSTFAIATKTSVAPKLSAPASVKAVLYGYNDVNVSWKAVSGATGYQVYYKKSTESKYKNYKATTKTSLKVPNLSSGAQYTFKVVPYKTVGSTKYTGSYKVSSSIDTLKKVAIKSAKKSGAYTKITWKKVQGADGYQIAKGKKKNKKFSSIKTVKKKITSLKVKTKKKKYYFKVRAYKVVSGKKIYAPWSAAK